MEAVQQAPPSEQATVASMIPVAEYPAQSSDQRLKEQIACMPGGDGNAFQFTAEK